MQLLTCTLSVNTAPSRQGVSQYLRALIFYTALSLQFEDTCFTRQYLGRLATQSNSGSGSTRRTSQALIFASFFLTFCFSSQPLSSQLLVYQLTAKVARRQLSNAQLLIQITLRAFVSYKFITILRVRPHITPDNESEHSSSPNPLIHPTTVTTFSLTLTLK